MVEESEGLDAVEFVDSFEDVVDETVAGAVGSVDGAQPGDFGGGDGGGEEVVVGAGLDEQRAR